MGRPPVIEGMGEPKRGRWHPEEDIKLVSYIQEHGPGNWRLVPSNAGLQRCGKSCRLRWKNYLRPGIKRGNFTPEEDRVIIRYQALLGNRWAAIAAHLPSRTDNDMKNYWHTNLKKKLAKVNSSGDERAKNHEGSKHNAEAATSGLDYLQAYYEKMYKSATAGNSMITAPQNNEEKKSVYDDNGISPLTSIDKWLLEDPSAPLPQVLSAPAPAQLLSAPAPAQLFSVPAPAQLFPAPAPFPQVLSAPASAAVSHIFPAPAPAPVPQAFSALTPIEKWLLENPSALVPQALPAPVPQVFPAPVSAPVPQVLPARAPVPFAQVPPAPASAPGTTPGYGGQDHLLNMFTSSRPDQISFGPFYRSFDP